MVWDRLRDLFSWDGSILENIEDISLIKIEDNRKFEIEDRTLQINLSELNDEELGELREIQHEYFSADERFFGDDDTQEAEAIERNYDEEDEELLEFFDNILTDRYLSVIESGLHLRASIEEQNLDKNKIKTRRHDIASSHGKGAYYLTTLATEGYFDPNGGIRDLLATVRLNEGMEMYNFQNELETLVENKLLCVFVENDDTVREVVHAIRGRMARHREISPLNSWLDVSGIGPDCETIILQAMEKLQDDYMSLDYDNRTDLGKGLRIRIHMETVPRLD